MSILQDLDPQYAKIYQPAASRSKKIALWIAGTLLVLIWCVWIAFTLQTDSKLAPTFEAVKADALAASATFSPAKTVQENPPQAIPPEREVKPETPPASAIINDNRNIAEKSLSEQAVATDNTPKNGEATAASPAVKPDKLVAASKPKAKPQAKVQSKAAPKLATKTPAQDKTKKAPVIASKKATERDVDIISAIVR